MQVRSQTDLPNAMTLVNDDDVDDDADDDDDDDDVDDDDDDDPISSQDNVVKHSA